MTPPENQRNYFGSGQEERPRPGRCVDCGLNFLSRKALKLHRPDCRGTRR